MPTFIIQDHNMIKNILKKRIVMKSPPPVLTEQGMFRDVIR